MKTNLSKIENNISMTGVPNITGGKMTKSLSIKEMGKYIQDNARRMLADKDNNFFELPKMAHEYINKMAVKVSGQNSEKTLLLLVKGNDTPEIALELSKGSYEQILKDIDRFDFPEKFGQNIEQLKSYFIYGR